MWQDHRDGDGTREVRVLDVLRVQGFTKHDHE